MATHGSVRDQVIAEDTVFRPVAPEDHGPRPGTDVEQERGVHIAQVDEVGYGIAAGDQHRVDGRILGHQAAGHFHRRDRGHAACVQVDAPGAAGADAMGDIDGGRPQQVFAPFFGGAEHHVDVHRIDTGLVDRLAGRPNGHVVRVYRRVRDVLALDAQLFPHHPFGQSALLRDLLRGDVAVREPGAGGDDADGRHAFGSVAMPCAIRSVTMSAISSAGRLSSHSA